MGPREREKMAIRDGWLSPGTAGEVKDLRIKRPAGNHATRPISDWLRKRNSTQILKFLVTIIKGDPTVDRDDSAQAPSAKLKPFSREIHFRLSAAEHRIFGFFRESELHSRLMEERPATLRKRRQPFYKIRLSFRLNMPSVSDISRAAESEPFHYNIAIHVYICCLRIGAVSISSLSRWILLS